MSEYQYVAFRAIDRPLTDDELKYARTQSTRAEITRWSFSNEYHYGDFHGDDQKLLQRGYDVHLHYANYGVRTVMLRLPNGLPFAKSVWKAYVDGRRVKWQPDKSGPAGTLIVYPCIEPEYVEELWDVHDYVDDLAAVRNELVEGDLRALYTLWLCGTQDSDFDPQELAEPPVPAATAKASGSCRVVLEFFDIDPLTLKAADDPTLPMFDAKETQQQSTQQWIASLPEQEARALLNEVLVGDPLKVKAVAMERIRKETSLPEWPTRSSGRTLEQLKQRTEEFREKENARLQAQEQAAQKRAAQRAARVREERMLRMIANPQAWLDNADQLVAERGTTNYKAAAEILADLREALGEKKGSELVLPHAAKLAKKHPTLRHLTSSLRKMGLLPK